MEKEIKKLKEEKQISEIKNANLTEEINILNQ